MRRPDPSHSIDDVAAEFRQVPAWANEFQHALLGAASSMRSYIDGLHRKQGVTGMRILYHLVLSGGAADQRDLCSISPTTKQAVAGALKILERQGLIVRPAHDTDRRRRIVRITETGVQATRESLPLRKDLLERLAECVGEKKASSITPVLWKIFEHYLTELKTLDRTQRE